MTSYLVLLLRLLETGSSLPANNINIYYNECHLYILSIKSRHGRMLNLGEIKKRAPFTYLFLVKKWCFISESFPCIEFNNQVETYKSEINFLISKKLLLY